MTAAHTRIVFCVNGPAQEATATGIEKALENGFFDEQREAYEERKNVLLEGLDKLGLPYTVPHGAYFVLVNTSRLQIPEDFEIPKLIEGRARDWVCAWFIAQTYVYQSFYIIIECSHSQGVHIFWSQSESSFQ